MNRKDKDSIEKLENTELAAMMLLTTKLNQRRIIKSNKSLLAILQTNSILGEING